MTEEGPLDPLPPELRAIVEAAESDVPPLPAHVDAAVHARVLGSVGKPLFATKIAVACALAVAGAGGGAHLLSRASATVEAAANVEANVAANVEGEEVQSTSAVDELRLVDGARRAVRRGALDEAQRLLGEHLRVFPHGTFAEERDALAALVELRLGRDPASTLDAFSRKHPGSVHRTMLDEAVRHLLRAESSPPRPAPR